MLLNTAWRTSATIFPIDGVRRKLAAKIPRATHVWVDFPSAFPPADGRFSSVPREMHRGFPVKRVTRFEGIPRRSGVMDSARGQRRGGKEGIKSDKREDGMARGRGRALVPREDEGLSSIIYTVARRAG